MAGAGRPPQQSAEIEDVNRLVEFDADEIAVDPSTRDPVDRLALLSFDAYPGCRPEPGDRGEQYSAR